MLVASSTNCSLTVVLNARGVSAHTHKALSSGSWPHSGRIAWDAPRFIHRAVCVSNAAVSTSGWTWAGSAPAAVMVVVLCAAGLYLTTQAVLNRPSATRARHTWSSMACSSAVRKMARLHAASAARKRASRLTRLAGSIGAVMVVIVGHQRRELRTLTCHLCHRSGVCTSGTRQFTPHRRSWGKLGVMPVRGHHPPQAGCPMRGCPWPPAHPPETRLLPGPRGHAARCRATG